MDRLEKFRRLEQVKRPRKNSASVLLVPQWVLRVAAACLSCHFQWSSRLSLPQDFDLKERVRSAVDIVDVIGATVELQPQGRNLVARCPWHNDRRPSMTVNQERQTWKCWPCDIGGDIFSFVMKRDGVDFPT